MVKMIMTRNIIVMVMVVMALLLLQFHPDTLRSVCHFHNSEGEEKMTFKSKYRLKMKMR